MPATVTGDDEAAGRFFTDYDGDLHQNGALYIGAETEGLAIKGWYDLGTIAVTVPSITDPDCAVVAVDVSAVTVSVAVGDHVFVTPIEATEMPTNCRLGAAYVSATDTVSILFHSEGGNVTGAAKNFNMVLLKRI